MLVTYFVNFRLLNDHLFGKELFIRFSASAFRKLPSIYIFSYFPFGFEGRMWDLIVSVPDYCLSFYFPLFASLGTYFTLRHTYNDVDHMSIRIHDNNNLKCGFYLAQYIFLKGRYSKNSLFYMYSCS